MRKSVLVVTGGAGFIGSHLTKALLDKGFKVRVLDDLSSGKREKIPDGAELIEASIADPDACRDACKKAKAVFNLAAIPSVQASFNDPLKTQLSGEVGTLTLLQAAAQAGVKKFIQSSSASVYGNSEDFPFEEDGECLPLSPYAASKLACEHYVRVFSSTSKMTGISLRYFNVYGKGQDPSSSYAGVITRFLDVMRNGESPVIHGDGWQSRDYIHVDDVVEANLLTLTCYRTLAGEAMNVGTGRHLSVRAVVFELNKVLNTDIKPTYEQLPTGTVLHSFANPYFAEQFIGFKAKVKFEDGIRRLIA